MRSLYWNASGPANPKTRLALRDLIVSNKPDFVFLAEPWMDHSKFPGLFWARLGLKLFANARENMLSKLWCVCRDEYRPHVVAMTAQSVAFSVLLEGKLFNVAAVYGATTY